MEFFRKRSVLLLISLIIGLAYAIYIIYYFGGAILGSQDTAEAVASGLATTLVAPHIICVVLAVFFNLLGWAGNYRWAALVGGILYAAAMITFWLYAPFVLIEMILSFVGFARMKKIIANQA